MSTKQLASNKSSVLIPIIIVGVLFFILGFVTWINSTLINFLKIACEIDNNVVLFLVTSSFYISYLIMSVPSSWVLNKTGYKKGMALGLLGIAIGALIFIPAANSRTYGIFLFGLFVQGIGMALLQTAVNPYITILGPLESAAKRISIMGICNKVAGAISPLILSAAILVGADAIESQLAKTTDLATRESLLNGLAHKVIAPYVILAVIMVIIAIAVWFSSLPEIKQNEEGDLKETPISEKRTSIFQFPHLIFAVIALFLYVGCEVMAGDTIGQYGRMLGYDVHQYQNFTTYTMGFMVVGYIIGILLIPKRLSQRNALWIYSTIGLAFTVCVLFTSGWLTILFVALLGFANSIMWPAIWPLALNKLGRFTKIGAALLIMALSGGAILPLIWGAIANISVGHPQLAYLLFLPCYAFILYFALKGYKAGLRSN
ncbi:MAG: glucose/galactose MFS transporter [Chitinophagaceae bacterium]|jgi:glucose/galactose transporter|nr:MAG: glucose/galactose MFS transporter [Chitinophagaceae bacterium]